MQCPHAQNHRQQCAILRVHSHSLLRLQTSTAGSEPSPCACRASSLFILGFSVRVCHTRTCTASIHNTTEQRCPLSNQLSIHSYEENPHSYFGTVVRFGLQFIHGYQSLKKAALQEAHWCLPVKTSLRIGQHQSKGNGETCHVHWEGATGAPASVEANDLQEVS